MEKQTDMAFKISIPEPCGENWNEMTPTEKGAFCETCEKEVVDFTSLSDAEIAQKLDAGKKLCGRFRPNQLDRTIVPAAALHQSASRIQWRKHVAALGFTSLLVASCSPEQLTDLKSTRDQEALEVTAEKTVPPPPVLGAPDTTLTPGPGVIDLYLPIGEACENRGEAFVISGTARDYSGQVLPGVYVVNAESGVRTQADSIGKFSISIHESKLKNPGKVWLLFLKELPNTHGVLSTMRTEVVAGEEVYYTIRDTVGEVVPITGDIVINPEVK
ncbi:carboxypeptidase-like regulatory domain-containing protein [Robiginitalea biformata]|nr:carboxypeptidase-like regulatory domain-containing protein [Robiginitalea biformata]